MIGTHDGILDACRCRLIAYLDNVVDPVVMLLQRVGRDADDLHVPLEELRLSAERQTVNRAIIVLLHQERTDGRCLRAPSCKRV